MKTVALSAASALLLAACATSSDPAGNAPPPAPAAEVPTTGGPAPTTRRVRTVPSANIELGKDYLPYLDVALNEAAVYAEFGSMLQDRYTRIQIVTLLPDAYNTQGLIDGTRRQNLESRNYKDESRGWLSRMMGSKSITRTLVAEFDIAQPDIKATEALFSASFSSNRQEGENWSTNESIALYATPYFKVGANTTIQAKVRMQLADQRERVTSSNVLGALTTAANAIAPASVLVTSFTAPRIMEASNFLDNSVSTLFGQSITEESVSSFSVQTWSEQPIIVIDAQLPDDDDITDTKGRGNVGRWAVFLDEPIPSILSSSTVDGFTPDFTDVTSGDILSFKVGEDLTVYDYVFSRLDLADRITNLNATGDPDIARLICSRIDRGLSEIGFNSFDSAAGVWAAAQSDQFTQLAASAVINAETCEAMTRWQTMQR
ncbi:MAG: hypothetical protein AAFW65_01045 [Pseudomonadota bacterium]